ncbi:MAG: sensor histidine kinase, partial [Candidatus Methylomirabilales bacterium]
PEAFLGNSQAYYRTSQESAMAFAKQIAQRISEGPPLPGWAPEALRGFLQEKLREYHLSSIQVFTKGPRALVQVRGKQYPSKVSPSYARVVRPALNGETSSLVQSLPHGDLIWGVAPLSSKRGEVVGAVVVSAFVPEGFLHKAQDITAGIKEYKQLKMWKSPIKGIYLMLFLMVTLVIIFAAVWVGIHLARGITVPIQQLAEGTRAVAAGNLDYKVEVKADDEIGILVESFNRMTEDLRKSKMELESANLDLQRSYEELERRRAYMETVLESIATGVLSLDQAGVVNTVNRAALRILDLPEDKVLGRPFQDLFQGEAYAPIRVLLERAILEAEGSLDQQVLFPRNGRLATLVVNISRLWDGERNSLGIVMVLEEITELIKAQQAMAWREVARRIAHEIKNPLTPIKLSTQRLRKKFIEGAPDYNQIFEECTRTIIQEVEGLKGLVDEFSRYARMPSSNPQPGHLLPVVEKVVALYADLRKGVKVRADLDPDLPPVNLDPEQMKRALVNLVDNALAAIRGKGEIVIRAKASPDSSRVLLEVIDTGRGISPEDKDRLFLPYFSTKRSGTGLGLAIVYRIVAEHGGTIRAEDNLPKGTRMIIELPALPQKEAISRQLQA